MTCKDYSAEAVAACKSVLIELVHMFGEFRDQVVIVGGWVPVLLIISASEPHPGTLDIDLALDVAKIPEDTYRTILKAFLARGYRQDAAQPFRFFRTIGLAGGKEIDVEVDLLTGEYGGTGPRHRTQRVQDVRARKARGCDLVFSNHVEVVIEGELPGGGRDRVTFRVAAIVPWIVRRGSGRSVPSSGLWRTSVPGGLRTSSRSLNPETAPSGFVMPTRPFLVCSTCSESSPGMDLDQVDELPHGHSYHLRRGPS